jgi:signal transduction histidine kinase
MTGRALVQQAEAGREIQDIVAHALGAVLLQLAAVESILAAEEVDRVLASRAVAHARHLAAGALADARRGVDILRANAPPLIESLQRIVEAGLGTFLVSGQPRPTTGGAFVALRRTIEEGLTNVAKHAPGATARVHLEFAADTVAVSISDDGIPLEAVPEVRVDPEDGWGIVGLREQAALLGGTLTARACGHGWQVRLVLPNHGLAPYDVMRELLLGDDDHGRWTRR